MPLYDTLGENAVEYIISHSGTSALFASADKLPTLAKALPKLERGQVSTIVYWGTGAGKDARFEQARKPAKVSCSFGVRDALRGWKLRYCPFAFVLRSAHWPTSIPSALIST